MTKALPVWLTRQEAADRAGVSLRTIANCLADGRLTKHKDRLGRVKIDAAEVDALAFPQPQGGSAPTPTD